MKNKKLKTTMKTAPEASTQPARKTTPAKLSKCQRLAFILYAAGVLLLCCMPMNAFAAATDPLVVINNLSDFVFSLVRAIGMILTGWGIVQIGLSFQSHDPSQRSNGFLTFAGGLVIMFAKEILDLIIGG